MNYPLPSYGYHSVYGDFNAVMLYQTASCPNHCVFCAKAQVGHSNRTMSVDDLRLVLTKLPDADFPRFVWLHGGGEVCLLKDLPERIALVRAAWPKSKIGIISTFNIWHGKDWVANVFEAGLDRLILSCYGHTEEDYSKLHGSKLFGQLCKNIKSIGELPAHHRVKVQFRYFQDSEHLFHINDASIKLEQFKNFLDQNGIQNFEERTILKWQPSKPVTGDADWQLSSPCSVVWGGSQAGTLVVLENLDVVPCCMFTEPDYVLGNLRFQSLADIFNSEKYRFFYETWWNMRPGDLPLCNNCHVYSSSAYPDELARLAAWQARELRGKKVVFWGCGEAYRAYKSFFIDCQPVAMLSDFAERPAEIDGIPVFHPDDFFGTLTGPLPLVIFAMQKASPKILQTLKEKYGFYTPSKLVICPANAQILAPVEPFFQD